MKKYIELSIGVAGLGLMIAGIVMGSTVHGVAGLVLLIILCVKWAKRCPFE